MEIMGTARLKTGDVTRNTLVPEDGTERERSEVGTPADVMLPDLTRVRAQSMVE